jgi:putative transposase
VNRGNDRRTVFREDEDYQHFVDLLDMGRERFAIEMLGHCVMPNHFHLLLRPAVDNALSAYMQWVTCRYACDLRHRTDTVGHGHVFQRRFWSAPVDGFEHYLAVLRYIEANPIRARLVARAEEWRWSSLAEHLSASSGPMANSTFALPADWRELVNLPQGATVLEKIRLAIARRSGRPPADR